MKTQIIILAALVMWSTAYGQKLFKTTDQPCTPKMVNAIEGRWVKNPDILNPSHIGVTKAQVQEIINRLNAVHNLALETYPNLVGVDAGWFHTLGYATFADEIEFIVNENGMTNAEAVRENPVAFFYYRAAFFNYFCHGSKQNEIWSGLNGETSTFLKVFANNLSDFLTQTEYKEDDATVDGRPIKLRKSIIGKWKGFDLFSEGGPGMENYASRYVLVHRNGELPYIPVSRKQYLDRCLSHFQKFYTKILADMDQISDPQLRSEQKNGMEKQKLHALTKYRDELETTTKEGLLNSPAIIRMPMFNVEEGDVFISEVQGGSMLVIENPKYMRKDLPKYIPQLYVLFWSWQPDAPGEYFRKMMENNFPVEKLQSMIDK